VTVFIGGADREPGIVAYGSGILESAAPDAAFDALYPYLVPGEALHFQVVDEAGARRFAFVLWERFFFTLHHQPEADALYSITQRDVLDFSASDPEPPKGRGIRITIRLDDVAPSIS
jgi:hypothetical protein